tara:strand:+ start:11867 stop:13030 length:1164 start_codon:yes stop_codon:yes gene_type:complete
MNKDVVIVDCVRTPMARSKNGAFRHVRAESLSASVMQALLQRNPALPPKEIDDVYWGCVQQTLEQGFNIAKNAALLAGLPHTVPAVTINRLCGSSMEALHQASRSIMTGMGKVFIVGGVEHMGHIPMTYNVDFHPHLGKYVAKGSGSMGLTAEMLAMKYEISREEQDLFALRSHQKAHQATLNQEFDDEIHAIEGHDSDGGLIQVTQDEVIRPDTSLSSLEQLKPVFNPRDGSITAGTSSAISDGASAMLVMSREQARALELPILAVVRSMAVSGCAPSIMGIGPVAATRIALERANMELDNIDALELNEAFAAQTLACIKELGLQETYDNKVNLKGGAIALGHPLGCSGARICTTLLHTMQQKNYATGLATMCIGLGQGIATIFER